jgi:hypothetical protein
MIAAGRAISRPTIGQSGLQSKRAVNAYRVDIAGRAVD